ncbi:hypothetical protein PGB90_003964 [Kerria lacca]
MHMHGEIIEMNLVCEKKELRSLEAVVGDFIDTKFIRIKLKTYYVNIAVLEELDLMVVVSVMGLLTLILKVLNHQREYESFIWLPRSIDLACCFNFLGNSTGVMIPWPRLIILLIEPNMLCRQCLESEES